MSSESTADSADALSKILMESFYSPMKSISSELEKLEQSQLGWLLRVDVENSKFLQTDEALKEAIVLLQQVPAYTAKLQAMKKDMANLSSQTKALAVKTTKLKEKKQKEIQDRIDKDRLLLAQPASPLASQPSSTSTPSSSSSMTTNSMKPLTTPL